MIIHRNAASAAAAMPPLDDKTIDLSPTSHVNPCDWANAFGVPVSTARTYAASWVRERSSRDKGLGGAGINVRHLNYPIMNFDQ